MLCSFEPPKQGSKHTSIYAWQKGKCPVPLECSLSWEFDFSCQNPRPSRVTVHDGSVSFSHSVKNFNNVQRAEASEDLEV